MPEIIIRTSLYTENIYSHYQSVYVCIRLVIKQHGSGELCERLSCTLIKKLYCLFFALIIVVARVLLLLSAPTHINRQEQVFIRGYRN